MNAAVGPEGTPNAVGDAEAHTRFERDLVLRLLSGRAYRRILDGGTGAGRLLPVLTRLAEQCYAVDMERGLLRQARSRMAPDSSPRLVGADVQRLPFRPSAFDAALLIRVYHRLPDPMRALAEMARVLRTGGVLVLSVHPRPSLRTLYHQVASPVGARGLCAAPRASAVRVGPDSAPGWVETLSTTEARLRAAGFHVTLRCATGFDELPVLRALPESVWMRVAGSGLTPPLSPCVFLVSERLPGAEENRS